MYYPKGFVNNGTNINTTNSAGAIDISDGAVIPLTAVAGAPPARVLFILKFIG